MQPQICDRHGDCLIIYPFLTKCPICKIEKESNESKLKANYWETEFGDMSDRLQKLQKIIRELTVPEIERRIMDILDGRD
jgi:hypothetical protein